MGIGDKVYVLRECRILDDEMVGSDIIGVYTTFAKALLNKKEHLDLVNAYNGYDIYYCYDIEEFELE